ncbi:MAG: sialate O-acetylesterase [Bacteroidetes bacterium]|nr:sialate O-acetylesterase [Bacteroidota bacterium]
MKTIFSIGTLILLLILSSCKKNEGMIIPKDGYDVILVIGQSNTHQGIGLNFLLDAPNERIKQLGRFGDNNMKIITAREPLDHFTKIPDKIGFAMTFAKAYKNQFLSSDKHILIIPGGMGATGFSSHYWNKGDTLYNDAVMRTNFVVKNFKSKLVAILWHQGESDIGNPDYQQNLDSMIVNIRKDITGGGRVPFVLGGMVPYWIQQNPDRMIINNIIENTVNRIQKTGYANPEVPFTIEKSNKDFDSNHFDANGLRQMGLRYFSEFVRLS